MLFRVTKSKLCILIKTVRCEADRFFVGSDRLPPPRKIPVPRGVKAHAGRQRPAVYFAGYTADFSSLYFAFLL